MGQSVKAPCVSTAMGLVIKFLSIVLYEIRFNLPFSSSCI